jgi:hypothetical protein
MDSLRDKSIAELLALHVAILEELRMKEVLRSANNPAGDLAEYLFCTAFGWTQAGNSAKAFDATGDDGTRYQIKGRRIHRRNRSRRLSAMGRTGLKAGSELRNMVTSDHIGEDAPCRPSI